MWRSCPGKLALVCSSVHHFPQCSGFPGMPPVSGIKPAPPSAQKVKSGMHTRNRVVSDHFCTLLAFRPSITAPGPLPVLGFDVSICTPQSGPVRGWDRRTMSQSRHRRSPGVTGRRKEIAEDHENVARTSQEIARCREDVVRMSQEIARCRQTSRDVAIMS